MSSFSFCVSTEFKSHSSYFTLFTSIYLNFRKYQIFHPLRIRFYIKTKLCCFASQFSSLGTGEKLIKAQQNHFEIPHWPGKTQASHVAGENYTSEPPVLARNVSHDDIIYESLTATGFLLYTPREQFSDATRDTEVARVAI